MLNFNTNNEHLTYLYINKGIKLILKANDHFIFIFKHLIPLHVNLKYHVHVELD